MINNSFEDTDTNGLPINWSYVGDNTSFFSGSTTRSYDGSRSLKFHDTSSSQDALARSEEIAVVPGNQYVARAKGYVESGEAYFYLEFFNSFGTRIQEYHTGLSVTGSWQTISVDGEAPSNASYARVSIYTNGDNMGTSYFDQVSLNAQCSLVANSSFDYIDNANMPIGWTLLGDNIGFFSGSDTRASDGKWSIKIDDTSSSQDALARSNNISVVSGYQYSATADCYLESGVSYLYLEFFNDSGVRVQENHTQLSTTGSWQTMSITGTAPSTARYACVSVYSNPSNVGISYFDSVKLESEFVYVDSTKQLFIDDYIIDSMINVTRNLNAATKTSPVITPEYDWEGNTTYIYGSVIKDEQENIYKMWYQAAGEYICYATSSDGVNWTKPLNLGIATYNGNTNNNIVLAKVCPAVIKDMSETDSNKRYKMMVFDHSNYAIYYSSDGKNWSFGKNLFDSYDVCTMAYDSINKKYIAAVKEREPNARIARMTSSYDFENWTTPIRMNSLADAVDGTGYVRADCYGLGLYPYEGVYIGFDWMLHITGTTEYGDDGTVETQLVYSRDITDQWMRPDRNQVIELGVSGSWDDGMIYTASYPIRVGNEIWLYYGGYDDTHGTASPNGKIAIAKWRLDGFMSLDSDSSEGTIVTKKLKFTGSKLTLNAKADGTGNYIKVELLDSNGSVINGYSKNDCTTINSDNVEHTVSWTGGSDISSLAGQEIQVKIYTKGSKVYSLQFKN